MISSKQAPPVGSDFYPAYNNCYNYYQTQSSEQDQLLDDISSITSSSSSSICSGMSSPMSSYSAASPTWTDSTSACLEENLPPPQQVQQPQQLQQQQLQPQQSTNTFFPNNLDFQDSFFPTKQQQPLDHDNSIANATANLLVNLNPEPAIPLLPYNSPMAISQERGLTGLTAEEPVSKKRVNPKPVSEGVRKKRRVAANARERKRMTGLNLAFGRLRRVLDCNRDRPLSKMEALTSAQCYIKELLSMLAEK